MFERIKRQISRFLFRKKDVWLAKGSVVQSSFLEGKNAVGKDSFVIKCHIGLGTYLGRDCYLHRIKIGRFCSIANGLRAGMGSHPTSKFVSTFPAFYYNTEREIPFTFFKKDIPQFSPYSRKAEDSWITIVENDVWLGERVFLADGITIGNGAIVAAGSVVTKDVEPYSIVAGVPAREIRKRFSQEQINFLLIDQWWNKGFDWIEQNHEQFFDISEYIRWRYEK